MRGLKNRGWNWDERGSAAGSPLAIDRAVVLLDAHVFQVLGARNLAWNEPHVSLNEDGDVVFEWWNGEKKLTLYVGEKVTEYLSSWGPDIDQQMYAGELNGNLLQLWQWFLLPAEQ